MFPLNSLITRSSLISCNAKDYWSMEKMKLTAGSTDVYGKTPKTTAMKSKLKRKVMGTTKNPTEWPSFCSGKRSQKVKKEKLNLNLIKKGKTGQIFCPSSNQRWTNASERGFSSTVYKVRKQEGDTRRMTQNQTSEFSQHSQEGKTQA